MDVEAMAQRWHDTDHGRERGKPIRQSRFLKPAPDPQPDWVSSCWCCCQICDPDWNTKRPSPFWTEATKALHAALIR